MPIKEPLKNASCFVDGSPVRLSPSTPSSLRRQGTSPEGWSHDRVIRPIPSDRHGLGTCLRRCDRNRQQRIMSAASLLILSSLRRQGTSPEGWSDVIKTMLQCSPCPVVPTAPLSVLLTPSFLISKKDASLLLKRQKEPATSNQQESSSLFADKR